MFSYKILQFDIMRLQFLRSRDFHNGKNDSHTAIVCVRIVHICISALQNRKRELNAFSDIAHCTHSYVTARQAVTNRVPFYASFSFF